MSGSPTPWRARGDTRPGRSVPSPRWSTCGTSWSSWSCRFSAPWLLLAYGGTGLPGLRSVAVASGAALLGVVLLVGARAAGRADRGGRGQRCAERLAAASCASRRGPPGRRGRLGCAAASCTCCVGAGRGCSSAMSAYLLLQGLLLWVILQMLGAGAGIVPVFAGFAVGSGADPGRGDAGRRRHHRDRERRPARRARRCPDARRIGCPRVLAADLRAGDPGGRRLRPGLVAQVRRTGWGRQHEDRPRHRLLPAPPRRASRCRCPTSRPGRPGRARRQVVTASPRVAPRPSRSPGVRVAAPDRAASAAPAPSTRGAFAGRRRRAAASGGYRRGARPRRCRLPAGLLRRGRRGRAPACRPWSPSTRSGAGCSPVFRTLDAVGGWSRLPHRTGRPSATRQPCRSAGCCRPAGRSACCPTASTGRTGRSTRCRRRPGRDPRRRRHAAGRPQAPAALLEVLRDARRRLPPGIRLRAVIVGDGPQRGVVGRSVRAARHGLAG